MPRWSGVLARIKVSHVGDANLHHLSRGAALPSSARRRRGTGQPILLAQCGPMRLPLGPGELNHAYGGIFQSLHQGAHDRFVRLEGLAHCW